MRAILFLLIAFSAAAQVVDTSRSPHARLRAVPVKAVDMGDGFWAPRMAVNVERSIPTLLDLLEEHGVVDNFRRLAGKDVARRGPLYTDSDLYKWMEAVAFAIESGGVSPALEATMDKLIDTVLAVQEPSGYLNTWYVDERRSLRFTEQQRGHELYCLGHMLQAGIAYDRARGKRKLLDGGIRFANYVVENFGPEKRPALTGHPELEMAMVELFRTTGDRRYLDFAGYLLTGERERLKLREGDLRYMFSGRPFTSRTRFEGHAVRAMYAACGATDYWTETGGGAYRATLETLWRDMAGSKLYITGGVGSRSSGEAFGEAYELPNALAYTESCAAIGSMMWNWRLLLASGEARFADEIERALYNGINSGMSLSGTMYCYRNPLESAGEKIRRPWYDTTCCPPNLQRTLASLPGYLYATGAEGLYVNLYHDSVLDWRLENGAALKVAQRTRYPWDGAVELTVEPAEPAVFSLFLRIPSWSAKSAATVNGKPVAGVRAGRYLEIRRQWARGDRVALSLDVAPRLTAANPLLRENAGRVAVERGPLVYCLEKHDNAGVPSLFDTFLPAGRGFTEERRPELLGGVVTLRHPGMFAEKPLAGEPLYRPFTGQPEPARPAELVFVPYYAWANREPAEMQVWVRVR
jgi:uncharacterized protein